MVNVSLDLSRSDADVRIAPLNDFRWIVVAKADGQNLDLFLSPVQAQALFERAAVWLCPAVIPDTSGQRQRCHLERAQGQTVRRGSLAAPRLA